VADRVVCHSPADGRLLLKRVVGVPGDKIELKDNKLIVNGTAATYRDLGSIDRDGAVMRESVFNREHLVTLGEGRSAPYGPKVVPAGEYLLMGDNRDNSFDSRFFGFVSRVEILGRATRIVASVDPDRSFRPRFDRFLKPLE
jgi:signal peptidase I